MHSYNNVVLCLASFTYIFRFIHAYTRILFTIHTVELLFSHSVMSNSLQPYELQHARLPCPSLCTGVFSDSSPLSWLCYLTISSSAAPFSFGLQSSPASVSFPVSQLFASGGQSTGALASASVFPMTIQGRFPLGLTGLISLWSKRLSRVFSSTTI